LTDDDMASALAPAGLRFIERVHGKVRVPLPPGRGAANCRPEHGRIDCRPEEVADVEAPDMAAIINASWLRLATQYGLFTDEREFLLAADYSETTYEPDWAWVRAQLLEPWDLAGSGVKQLGSPDHTGRFIPEFTVVSLDGRTLLTVTVWGNRAVSTIVIRPDDPLQGRAM
jgi:hypothetical protein